MMPSKNHLIKLIENDDWESLEFLLDHTKLTYQLNKKINWSNTLLNIVIKNKKINCLKILLKHPNIQNCFCVLSKRNKICLDMGIQTNNIQIIQLLLEHPQIHLCLDIKSDDGYTPLDLITLLPTNIKIYQIYMEIKRWNARKWWILGCTECLINID